MSAISCDNCLLRVTGGATHKVIVCEVPEGNTILIHKRALISKDDVIEEDVGLFPPLGAKAFYPLLGVIAKPGPLGSVFYLFI